MTSQMHLYCDSTPDLVDRIFGKIATVRLASLVLLTFLHSKLLTVELDGKELIRDQWPDACAFAASSADARAASTNADPSSDSTKDYLWKWCEILDDDTLHGVENFFNVVGLSAYIAAMTSGASEELSNREVTTRFATLPRSYGPLSDPTSPCSLYSPPDFFVLPSTSYVSKNTRNASHRRNEFLEKPSPLCIIKEKFPFILSRIPHILPEIMGRLEGPLESGLSTASDQISNPTAPFDPTMSIRDELMAFAASLEGDVRPYALPQVEQVLREQHQRGFLDLSRICAPEVLVPGVISMDISPEQMRTVMQYTRRFQPWLRSLLSLAINEDELGLFRADAAGLQEFTFDRTTGFGVIQCIRIALGITVATNEELGIHPAFSFRETVSKPLSTSDHETGANDAASNAMPPSKRARKADSKYRATRSGIPSRPKLYRFKEVNFCTLENRNLRMPHCNAVGSKSKYYVKYLLEDERSLFGRSTRTWCVYKEVLDEERGKYPETTAVVKTCPLFVGPFALKLYNADVNHETYKYNLIQKAMEANVRYVILPKHVWYLGRVVQNLRPEGCLESHDSELGDREEIMMISPFKRTLAQFSDAGEFYRGLIDAAKGIESLENAGLMHCDVSINNILLEAEPYPAKEVVEFATFSADGTADTEIALLFRPSGSDGGLHDLDLLERTPVYQESDEEEREFNPVGTFPFISIQCLAGQKHIVADDMYSLFYVLYLSMFQLVGPVPNCYPSATKQVAFEYPKEIKYWADESSLSGWTKTHLFAHMGAKISFFQRRDIYIAYPPWYITAATQSLPFWRNHFAVHRVFLTAFHEILWSRPASNGYETIWDSRRIIISPRMLIEQLEKYEGELRDILKGLK